MTSNLKTFLAYLPLISASYAYGPDKQSPKFSLAVQTDLMAYTTKGGYSLWATARHNQNQLSLSFVNYPNRDNSFYKESGLKENDRFLRIGLSRYWGKKKMKNFFYGVNVEFHWRELLEDGSNEIIKDTYWQFAPIVGYDWFPLKNKENQLKNFSTMLWAGPRFHPNYYKQDRVFENTGSVYPIPDFINASFGINLSYTFLKK